MKQNINVVQELRERIHTNDNVWVHQPQIALPNPISCYNTRISHVFTYKCLTWYIISGRVIFVTILCDGQVSGAQRGRERHAAPSADAHGGRLAARAHHPRPLPPPRPATDTMEHADVPRHRPLAFDKVIIITYFTNTLSMKIILTNNLYETSYFSR